MGGGSGGGCIEFQRMRYNRKCGLSETVFPLFSVSRIEVCNPVSPFSPESTLRFSLSRALDYKDKILRLTTQPFSSLRFPVFAYCLLIN